MFASYDGKEIYSRNAKKNFKQNVVRCCRKKTMSIKHYVLRKTLSCWLHNEFLEFVLQTCEDYGYVILSNTGRKNAIANKTVETDAFVFCKYSAVFINKMYNWHVPINTNRNESLFSYAINGCLCSQLRQ